jgi:TonB family protein
MNIKIAAALLLSPLMVHAQANSPAQPQAAQAPELHASMAKPTGLMLSSASSSAADVPAAHAGAIRVSTGVVQPKLIRMVPIQENTVSAKAVAAGDVEAVVSLTVDAKGETEDLKIEKSVGSDLDREILDAVSQYRYQPATVSGQATAIPMLLHVVVREPAE